MKKQLFLLLLVGLVACHKPAQVQSISEEAIRVDSTWDAIQDTAYLQALAPTTAFINQEMNVVIGHAPRHMQAYRPESELLNWTSDALYEMACKHYNGPIDFAIVNIGGVRTDWPAGDITVGHLFRLMPFDNQLVILTMEGKEVRNLCENIAAAGGEGVSSNLRLVIDDNEAEDITIKGKALDDDAMYYVATSDYLSGGADGLTALTHFVEREYTGKLIRDLYIEHVRLHPTVESKCDGRITVDN